MLNKQLMFKEKQTNKENHELSSLLYKYFWLLCVLLLPPAALECEQMSTENTYKESTNLSFLN